MPDAAPTPTLAELRIAYDAAKRERNDAAMRQDVDGKLKWMNELYRLSAAIVREEKRLKEGTG